MKVVAFQQAVAFLVLPFMDIHSGKHTTRFDDLWVNAVPSSSVPSRIRHRAGLGRHRQTLVKSSKEEGFRFNPRHYDWLQKKYDRKRRNQDITNASGTQFTREEIDQVEKEINALSASTSQIELDTPRKDAFLGHCEDFLLSERVIGDDLISQIDSTNFLIEYCISVQVCEPDYTTTFEALNHKLQLSFTRFNCPFRFDGPQDQQCLDELDAQGDEFGYIISPNEDMDALRDRVVEYCSWLWHFGTDFHGGTEAPTSSPSFYPSFVPTDRPSTLAPTQGPSREPSGAPSPPPTVTVVPTSSPSAKPTIAVSSEPSKSFVPSMRPSKTPSHSPTQSPSALPSMHPSVSPSRQPSDSPTQLISNRPTTVPSIVPTSDPTAVPTNKPSTVPSNPPSGIPSSMPSIHPTDQPSVRPSMQQTSFPTSLPSFVPSTMPSPTPSHQPSVFPSVSPTLVPSSSPSVRPSSKPSTFPSDMPTGLPSFVPSTMPSPTPSHQPSVFPSVSPTLVPSSSPSARPSSKPSTFPSDRPSLFPTQQPTSLPSISPSVRPSARPSIPPSFKPSLSPSQTPTFVPSRSPSATPSRIPSKAPSESPSLLPSDHPSVAPSEVPSLAQSISPTMTPAPTAFPTEAVPFRVDFTYIAGFNNVTYSARSLDDAERYVFVMDDIRETIRKVLALDDITRRNLRRLIGFRGADPQFSQIYHKRVIDEDTCPESFVESLSCVRVVSEVIVYANPDAHDQESVGTSVRTPIKSSMNNGLFISSLEETEVKEILYLGDGLILVGDTDDLLGNDRGNLGEGGIAGIAVGSIILVAGIGLFAFTRSRAEDDRSGAPDIQSSDNSSASVLEPEIYVPSQENRNLPALKENNSFEEVNVSRTAQLDTETGVVIPAVTSGQSEGSANSSHYSDSDQEGEILICRLDAAVSAGDWAAVAAIAADLSTNDDASTMSSVNTSKLTNSNDRNGLTKEDAKRAAKLDQLIAEGDWNAVGMTAAAFDSASSTSGSEHSTDNPIKNIDTNNSAKKKSLIDFIAGPWQSSAASRAMMDDQTESQIKELNISSRSDGVSSLSGGLTPDRKKEVDLEVGAGQIRIAAVDEKSSESASDNDDRRPMLENKPEKKGWKGRLPSILRKKVVEPEAAPESFALHEDSSVSSWSRGSPESQGFTPYSDRKAKNDSIPEEMKAFGEDFGLAAAELAIRQEEEAKELSGDEKISQKSSNSLRDELDKAIETGDWDAVEAQTNKMLDVNMDDLKIEDTRKTGKKSYSSYEDSDDESRDGWSTSAKSMISGESDLIDDERIDMLEKLIETDDWQGIVTSSRIHNRDDSSMASSLPGDSQVDGLLSLATEKESAFGDGLDEDLSLATDMAQAGNI